MRGYNQIIALDTKKKTIRVQSGATWEQIQNYINQYGLSVRVMQSSNIFTVGGSLSSNVHGRNLYHGPLIETVNSFRLLTAEGRIINVSREENSELFGLVIGGFGLFGVILDVDLKLIDNKIYQVDTFETNYKEFPDLFHKKVLSQPKTDLAIARLSIDSKNLFHEMYVTTYSKTDRKGSKQLYTLQTEQNIKRNKFLLNLARQYDWGKSLVWFIQKKAAPSNQFISRNNAMRPEVKFLEYHSSNDTDILQEYFVPVEQFPSFVDQMRTIIQKENVNVLNATVRYIRENKEATLSYSKQDGFAIVILINQKLFKEGYVHTEQVTRQLVDAVLQNKGTYYLTYQLYPTSEQLRKAYPHANSFFEKKRKYDPNELFMNMFYEKYANSQK